MKIAVIGTGYVGLVSGTCLSEFGFDVTCVDYDREKIRRLMKAEIPIYEPGLEALVRKNAEAGRLHFTASYEEAMAEAEVVFIAVGTPSDEDGSADLRYVLQAATTIGCYMDHPMVVVDKSTVPVGTGQLVKQSIRSALEKRQVKIPFEVVSNPEFLREGSAIQDFMEPDRVVVGTQTQHAEQVMGEIYRGQNVIFCDIETAELIKYASNAYLSTRISFVNELAILCEAVGADVAKVSLAMGADQRIGPRYLNAGPGYGGSCFPKDTRALVSTGQDHGVSLSVVGAAIRANEHQRRHMLKRITDTLGRVKGQKIAVLGIAFKPDTDDIREAPAVGIIKELVYKGAKISTYDPVAMENAKKSELAQLDVEFSSSPLAAVREAAAVVVVTDWGAFQDLDMAAVLEEMSGRDLFDLRNIYDREAMEALGYRYYGVGRVKNVEKGR